MPAADRVRARVMGDGVHLRGLIEFSNICRMDCCYCGIRRSNRHVRRYRMTPEEIVAAAQGAGRLGYGSVVLQSGEGDALNPEELAGVVREIKATTPLAVTLSVGSAPGRSTRCGGRPGADRFLLRHETADPDLFARLRPGRRLEQRLQCLQWLRELGYQVGSGFMVGLPGQTVGTLADDILLAKRLNVEMAGIGPFIPAPNTPLADAPAGTAEQTLNAVAVRPAHHPGRARARPPPRWASSTPGRQLALACGANVIMPNVTPRRYREHYQLYPNKICLQEEPEQWRPASLP